MEGRLTLGGGAEAGAGAAAATTEDELDEDIFAAPAGTTLANIFETKLTRPSGEVNSSLKYVPPKPQKLNKLKEDVRPENTEQPSAGSLVKTSECLIAKAVFAHELVNGSYEPRGKLGFAILKMFNPEHYKIVLYNSEKKSISSASATANFEVTLQNNNYLTYYDDCVKNWSILFSDPTDISQVVEEINKCKIKVNQNKESNIVHAAKVDNKSVETVRKVENTDENVSSDEVKLNKQAKMSLLNRISMMGVPMIYPKPPLSSDRTSDSSDTNEDTKKQKDKPLPARHKVPKTSTVIRKLSSKINVETCDSPMTDLDGGKQFTSVIPVTNNICQQNSLLTYTNGQIVPVANHDSQRCDLNVFLSETRASNSEVRININRLSDKVDKVLDKIKLREDANNVTETIPNFTTEIFQKLLHEYETKISLKDAQIKSLETALLQAGKNKNFSEVNKLENKNCNTYEELLQNHDMILSENKLLKSELDDIKNSMTSKNSELDILRERVKELENHVRTLEENIQATCPDDTKFAETIISLENDIERKESKINEINILYSKALEDIEKSKSDIHLLSQDLAGKQKSVDGNNDFEDNIKSIMNNTFRTLVRNFDSEEKYSGDDIRAVVGSVIRQTTMDALTPGTVP